mmetsp:Transcript_21792/g.70506  ORF Transcript_21792/g.70506 Transcript_21792/m.70506 type:complete len:337 (+) Transcript_21792:320-1330(+)
MISSADLANQLQQPHTQRLQVLAHELLAAPPHQVVRVLHVVGLRAHHAAVTGGEGLHQQRHEVRDGPREADRDRRKLVEQVVADSDFRLRADEVEVWVRRVRVYVHVHDCQTLAGCRLVRKAAAHGVVDGREEPRLAEETHEVGLVHGPHGATSDHGEGRADATGPEVLNNLLQNSRCSGIDIEHTGQLQDKVLRSVDLGQVVQISEQCVLNVRGIGKVHRCSESHDEDIRDELAFSLLVDAPEDAGARHAPKDGELRPHSLVDDHHQGQQHGNADSLQRTYEQRAQERDKPKHEVPLLDPPQLGRDIVGDERGHRVDHDRGQREHREVVEQGREE